MLAAKFQAIFPHLDERQRRLLMGAEARALGRGGIRLVARAAGVREATVSLGVDELDSGAEPLGRARRPGGGRKRAAELDPGLRPALLALVEPEERGDPMSPLRWTTKSTRTLAGELTRQGHRVGADTVADLLRAEGFSLQGNAKTIEGTQHPDRNAQFRYINEQAKAHQDSADPVISVDTKKKENAGEFKNGGREWRPRGDPSRVRTHDFPDEQLGKAIPYGIYDLAMNAGWVSVGTDHDTAAFAVESIRRWWNAAGRAAYPGARQAADHRGRRRLQQLPHPRVEGRARRVRAAGGARGNGVPLPAGDTMPLLVTGTIAGWSVSTLAATRRVGRRTWPAVRKEYFEAGRLRHRSASRRRLTPLSSLRRTFAAIVAMTCLICTDVCADWRMTLRRTCLRTLTKEMRSGSIRSWPASRMMIRVRQWCTARCAHASWRTSSGSADRKISCGPRWNVLTCRKDDSMV